MQNIYIDTVLQVFESDGNLHIIGGLASGESDVHGQDVINKVLHMTMPMMKAVKILPDIANALPALAEEELPIAESEDSSTEVEGTGIHFKI